MRLVLHPKISSDIDKIMAYYEFYAELRHFMEEAAARPELYAIRERDIRRVNLQRFPYHFLFRIVGDVVRVLVVRHHSRHPSAESRRR
jgi:plasmid stabilization system protein ParE